VPEVPESIGIYHCFARSFNRGQRTHKLFLVCSGGCGKAADQFCNMLIDVGDKFSSGEIADSEEGWFLRRLCFRARCRLLKMLADCYGLRIRYVDDVQAYDSVQMAVHTVDTVENDIARVNADSVCLHNLCVDSTKTTNGILCKMDPTEGYWLFKGNAKGSSEFGGMFGQITACGAFPTRCPLVPKGFPNSVRCRHDASIIVKDAQNEESYMSFDESFFKNLERMQWNRDNGYVELIPIVVGM